VNVLVVLFLGRCENVGRRAHLDSQRQLGVDAVSGLCALLRCHFIGIWRGSWAVVEVVVGRLAAEVGIKNSTCACLQKFEFEPSEWEGPLSRGVLRDALSIT
jgi:hypothetical protein